MAGHSRWAQVKHKKAITDAKKGKLFSKVARMITVAAGEKGMLQEMNAKLKTAVEKARSLGMPSENIERAIKRAGGQGTGEHLHSVVYEAFGPAGVALLIEAITNNKNRTTAEIKHVLSEHGGRLGDKGGVEWMFQKMAALEIPFQNHDREELELLLIDAGAENIKEEDTYIIAYMAHANTDQCKQKLRDAGIITKDEYIEYVPQNTIAVENPESRKAVEELFEALDGLDDVQEIYTNIN